MALVLTSKQNEMLRHAAEKGGVLRNANMGRGSYSVATSLKRLGLAETEEHYVIDTIFRLELTLTERGKSYLLGEVK